MGGVGPAKLQLQSTTTVDLLFEIESPGPSVLGVDSDFTATFTGTFTYDAPTLILETSGPGTIDFRGDIVVNPFTSNATGLLQVTGGTTRINADWTLATLTTVSPGATLGGAGRIGPVTASGTVRPGNSIGTLTIVGDATFSPGSALAIEADDTGAASTIDVQGSMAIAQGTTLDVLFDPGSYSGFYKYTVATISGARTGEFTTVQTTGLPRGLSTRVVYSSDPTIYLLIASNGNCLNIGEAVFSVSPAPGSDFAAVLSSLQALPQSQLCSALDQLGPQQFGDMAQTQELGAVRVRETVTHRLRTLYELHCAADWVQQHPGTYWVEPFIDVSHQDRSGQYYSYHTATEGLVLGTDGRINEGLYLGGIAAFTYTDITWHSSHGNGHAVNGWAGVYTTYITRYLIPDFSFFASYNHYNEYRNIKFSTINRNANNKHNGYEIAGHFGLLGMPPAFHTMQCQPFAYVDYIYLREHPFEEHGADSLDLHVQHQNAQFIRTEAGGVLSSCLAFSGLRKLGRVLPVSLEASGRWDWWLVPELKLSWVWERPLDDVKYRASFMSDGVSFSTKGRDIVRNLFSLEVGLTALFSQRTSFGLRYAGEINDHYWDQRGYLRLDGWF